MHLNLAAKADGSGPIMYAVPAVQQVTSGSITKWNISIMVANLSATMGLPVTTIACSVKSVDPTKVIVTNAYQGANFTAFGFTSFLNGSWDPVTGDVKDLTAAQTTGVMMSAPMEIFKIEVQVKSFQLGSVVIIDIYDQYAADTDANTLISGDCLNDQTVNMVAIGTNTITWDSVDYHVTTVSNASSISAMTFDQPGMAINFTTTGTSGTTGYVNVTIPKVLLDASLTNWTILMDNNPVIAPQLTITENATHTFIYFYYSQSSHDIRITGTSVVPEFPSITILLALLTTMTVAFALIRKVHKKRWQTL